MPNVSPPLEHLSIPLERDSFVREMLRELAGVLEDVVGLEHAAGFISVVGQRMGAVIGRQYREELGAASLSREQVAQVLVDLKRRIRGDFALVEQSEQAIVMKACACPFGDKVVGRPSMCMMTSNVFGSITAQELGYARVELQRTIASGAPHCQVVVHLKEPAADAHLPGREYFGDEAP